MSTEEMKATEGLPGDRVWWVLLTGFLFFVATLLAAAGSGADMGLVRHIPGGDFTGHLAIYGTLAFLWGRGLVGSARDLWHPGRWSGRHWMLVAFVVAEEFSQIFWIHRTFSWLDMSGNALGLWLGFGLSGCLWAETELSRPTTPGRRRA